MSTGIMITNDGAIRQLEKIKSDMMEGYSTQVIEFAIEALEKQIPAKPNPHEKDWGFGRCPACDRFFFATDPHCWYCGQAIDWSDAEE